MECKICHKQFKVINNFHLVMHGMTCVEYKKLFPDAETHEKSVLVAIGTKARERQCGKKYSDESKKKMSETRKRKIKSGEIVTPFMRENKYGENNPRWGAKRRSEVEIKKSLEKGSKTMCELINSGKLLSKYGHFFSRKLNKRIFYRSSYELEMLNFLESSNSVVKYDYEKIYIPYLFKGVMHRYIPDFIVDFSCGSRVLIEVGTATFKLNTSEKESCKQEAAIKYCKDNSINYAIFTEKEIKMLNSVTNWVNCWEDLKRFCYSVTGNGKHESLKNKTDIWLISSQAPERSKSMGKVQRLECAVDQQIITPRVPDTKVKI